MTATVYIATSLDGFIAREGGELDWLRPSGPATSEDYGYRAFMATVDAVVMGRHTYEKVRSFGGEWPYEKPVFVLASRPPPIPPELREDVEHMSGEPVEILARLSGRGLDHVYVDGGKTVQRFLEQGAIERLIITRIPVLIGRGIPLFGPLSRDVHLRHIETRSYPDGLVQSEYEVVASPADEP